MDGDWEWVLLPVCGVDEDAIMGVDLMVAFGVAKDMDVRVRVEVDDNLGFAVVLLAIVAGVCILADSSVRDFSCGVMTGR